MITVTGNINGIKLKTKLPNEYYVMILAMMAKEGIPFPLQRIERRKR